MSDQPNPGSAEAVAKGCKCPVIDNHHGRGVPAGKDGQALFWRSSNCPIPGHHLPQTGSGETGDE